MKHCYFFGILMLIFSIGVEACMFFGVVASGESDSQFFRINQDSDSVKYAPNVHSNVGISAIAIHPTTKDIYAISGNNVSRSGTFYRVIQADENASTSLKKIRRTKLNNVSSLTFDKNGQLWAWDVGTGLHTINIQTGKHEGPIAKYTIPVGDITFSADGRIVYASESNNLYQYDFDTQQDSLVCDNLPNSTVGLMMSLDKTFYLSVPANKEISMLNTPSCTQSKLKEWPDDSIDSLVTVTLSCGNVFNEENPIQRITVTGCDEQYDYQVEDLGVIVEAGATGLQKNLIVTTKDGIWDVNIRIKVSRSKVSATVKMKKLTAQYRTNLTFTHQEVLTAQEPKKDFFFEIPVVSKKVKPEWCANYEVAVHFK